MTIILECDRNSMCTTGFQIDQHEVLSVDAICLVLHATQNFCEMFETISNLVKDHNSGQTKWTYISMKCRCNTVGVTWDTFFFT